MNFAKACVAGAIAALGMAAPAWAGPTYVFSTSVGTQPSDVGVITITQDGANSVDVLVDLLNSSYGFLNTGGPHTPFAFNLSGSGALSIAFTSPAGPPAGHYAHGTFSLNTAGGDNAPYGTFGVAIDDSAGNGSGNAYYGDLAFTLTRSGGLSTDNFISNGSAVFTADLTNGESTGAQAWRVGIDPPARVPEPLTLSMFGAGLAGAAAIRRRNKKTSA